MEVADNANRYCFVNGCRHPGTHSTHHHVCGRCGETGHGQMECNNIEARRRLLNHRRRELPRHMWCNIMGCNSRQYHTTRAHRCQNCGENHSVLNCNIQTLEEQFNRYGRANDIEPYRQYLMNYVINYPHGIYIETYAGMGCMMYIRCFENHPIMVFFLHSDNLGQYGPNTDDRPQRDRFLRGCINIPDITPENLDILHNAIRNIENNNVDNNENFQRNMGYAYQHNLPHVTFNCPFCRTPVSTGNAQIVQNDAGGEAGGGTRETGDIDECVICLSENSTIRFPECGHRCSCEHCFRIIAGYDRHDSGD